VPTPGDLNQAASLGTLAGLAVNEWMADPVSGSDWFELFNSESQPVALGGSFFTDDLTLPTLSPLPPLSFIGAGPNGFVMFQADGKPNSGADHVNFNLSKAGETIGLYSSAATLVTAVTFDVQQTGVSEGRFPDGAPGIVAFTQTVSPGESNYLPASNVVVNEVLSHTDPPLEDAIEFYNPTASAVSIGGWFLSNSQDNLKKYRVADGTTIEPFRFKVLYEGQFGATNQAAEPFTLNSAHGDRVFLSQVDSGGNLTGYRAPASFGPAANGVSFGRFTNSVGQVDYVALSAHTFGVDNPTTVSQFRGGIGALNAAPLVGPIVINELMFYPPLLGGVEDDIQSEYVELRNITASVMPLFDPAAPTNTWKLSGGVDYLFPQNTTLAPGGNLLLVSFDPTGDPVALAQFRNRYSLDSTVPLFGPYSGHLANSGETIELFKADPPQALPHPDAGFVPYVLVEKVSYLDASPWPTGAGGTGLSLQRAVAPGYANDPANWFVATPTVGRPNQTGPSDTNGDGLPDAWQVLYFGSITSPQAAPSADPDADRFNNLEEYLSGTVPNDPSSRLKLDAVEIAGSSRIIHFNAVAGHTYTILYTTDPVTTAWIKAADVPSQSSTGPVSISDPLPNGSATGFYRLVTPKLP
jgi:hypothetical protein